MKHSTFGGSNTKEGQGDLHPQRDGAGAAKSSSSKHSHCRSAGLHACTSISCQKTHCRRSKCVAAVRHAQARAVVTRLQEAKHVCETL